MTAKKILELHAEFLEFDPDSRDDTALVLASTVTELHNEKDLGKRQELIHKMNLTALEFHYRDRFGSGASELSLLKDMISIMEHLEE